jgi:hypothetical protein
MNRPIRAVPDIRVNNMVEIKRGVRRIGLVAWRAALLRPTVLMADRTIILLR